MSSASSSLLKVALPLLSLVATASPEDREASRRIEVRVETVANSEAGTVEPCEVVQAFSVTPSRPFTSWSTLGAAAGTSPHPAASRCGAGVFPRDASAASEPSVAPSVIVEVSAVVGWGAGAMDPGPLGAIELFLTLTTRHLTSRASDGKPDYGAPVQDHRSTRLEPGEEFLVPVALDAAERERLGVHEAVLRIRAGWAGGRGADEYGALAVAEAAPGAEVVLDGGVAGRAGADGRLLLSCVPVGQRDVRFRDVSGAVAARTISVSKGRTVLVAPGTPGGGSPPQPVVAANGKNAEGFQEYRRARDGAIMIQIPAGEFLMGNSEIEGSPLPHVVNVSSFLIDKLPLTVLRFKRFAAATGHPLPPDPYWGVHDDFPVAFVRWDEAKAYCEWAGGRLPTEAEREKAARGTDGRKFPWGSDPPSDERAVFGRYWGQQGNDTAGARPSGASPYGLLDGEGNMWEFCEDWWDPEYYKSSPRSDPSGPKTGVARVVRGGSWDSRWVALYASKRNFAYTGYREGDFGFRCAFDAPR